LESVNFTTEKKKILVEISKNVFFSTNLPTSSKLTIKKNGGMLSGNLSKVNLRKKK